jgi:hypothetical protein
MPPSSAQRRHSASEAIQSAAAQFTGTSRVPQCVSASPLGADGSARSGRPEQHAGAAAGAPAERARNAGAMASIALDDDACRAP